MTIKDSVPWIASSLSNEKRDLYGEGDHFQIPHSHANLLWPILAKGIHLKKYTWDLLIRPQEFWKSLILSPKEFGKWEFQWLVGSKAQEFVLFEVILYYIINTSSKNSSHIPKKKQIVSPDILRNWNSNLAWFIDTNILIHAYFLKLH